MYTVCHSEELSRSVPEYNRRIYRDRHKPGGDHVCHGGKRDAQLRPVQHSAGQFKQRHHKNRRGRTGTDHEPGYGRDSEDFR